MACISRGMPEVPVSRASPNAAKNFADKNFLSSSIPSSASTNAQPPGPAKRQAGKAKGWIYVVTVAVVSAGSLFWLHPSGPARSTSGDAVIESTLPLESFVVNLDSSGQRAYLRVGITLGLSGPLPRNNKEDVPIALVRDAVLSVLASSKPDQLLTAEGKRQLKADLLRAITERAPQLGVENVYFTEFLVQM